MAANKGTVFILDWLSHAEWPSLACCAGDIHSVHCVVSVCFKLFWLSNMGKQAVISHASNKGHPENMSAVHKTLPVTAAISYELFLPYWNSQRISCSRKWSPWVSHLACL